MNSRIDKVKDFGEVFTPLNIVKDMLNMLDSLPLEMLVLEPSCGDGNFLVEIIERKLKLCKSDDDVVKAYSTVYGVDIQPDNVFKARNRLKSLTTIDVDEILEWNIIVGDFLSEQMIRMNMLGEMIHYERKTPTGIFLVEHGGKSFDITRVLNSTSSEYSGEMDFRRLNFETMQYEYEVAEEAPEISVGYFQSLFG